jgi:very-short-patch-repair endonuclease
MDAMRHRARKLRTAMTDAEIHLWKRLRARQIEGFRFRRQVPIEGYVVDFLCPQAKLAIEVDGGQHSLRSGYDAQRTAALEQCGYRVVRYWNHDVLMRVEDVVTDIHRHLTRGFTPPRPSPSPAAKGREKSTAANDVKAPPLAGLCLQGHASATRSTRGQRWAARFLGCSLVW